MRAVLFILLVINGFLSASCIHSNRQPASKAKSVLYIGDSQSVGPLGWLVYKHFKKAYSVKNFNIYGVVSSSPRHWAAPKYHEKSDWLCKQASKKNIGRFNNKNLIPISSKICSKSRKADQSAFEFLNLSKPDYVVFQFLGNSMKRTRESIIFHIRELLSQLDDNQDCTFITTPPYYHTVKHNGGNKKRLEIEKHFEEAISNRCTIVRGMSPSNLKGFAKSKENFSPDLMHISRIGAEKLFNQISEYLP